MSECVVYPQYEVVDRLAFQIKLAGCHSTEGSAKKCNIFTH